MRLILPQEEYKKLKGKWKYDYSEEEEQLHLFLDEREKELKDGRKNLRGVNVDNLFEKADEDCQVRELITEGKGKSDAILVENEELGLRGTSSFKRLGENNWRSMGASNIPYIKVLTAIGLIFDNAPKGRFKPSNNRMKNLVEVWKQLYNDSWQAQQSKEELRNFIFDLAKYPYAVMRSFIHTKKRTINERVDFDIQNNRFIEEEKVIEEPTEVVRKRLDPRRVWIDDQAQFNRPDTISDWLWEEDYSWDALQAEFGDEPFFEKLHPDLLEEYSAKEETLSEEGLKKSKVFTVQFYENYWRDRVVARLKVGGKWVAIFDDPMPQLHKELSLTVTSWFQRTPNSIAGVAPVEMMRGNKTLRNQIKNMTIDQVVLSIFKLYFAKDKRAVMGGRNKLLIEPGVIQEGTGEIQTVDLQGPGQDSKLMIDFLDQEISDDTGMPKVLEGEIQGKTAYETAVAKESALKRLTLPRDNIIYALNREARMTTDLMYQAYSIPQVEHVVNPEDIKAYLDEVQNDERFYEWEEDENKNRTGALLSKKYKEFPLKIKKNKSGLWEESKDDLFFKIMPDFIRWSGDIEIDSQSMFSPSKELDKANVRALSAEVIKYLELPPTVAKKPLLKILERHDENPRDWLPDEWLNANVAQTKAGVEQTLGQGAVTPQVATDLTNKLANAPEAPITPQQI